MDEQESRLRDDVFSSFLKLGQIHPQLQDAQMLVGASEATAGLQRQIIRRSVDSQWIQTVEDTLPYLDVVMRNPSVAIEDIEEVTPVELARHISEKSIRHLAQHSNLILKVEGDQVTPSKILSIYRDETLITYENKFINTLLNRLFIFVSKRFKAISAGSGAQQFYELNYNTQFSHTQESGGTTNVKIGLHMEMGTPLDGAGPQDQEYNERYALQVERAERIFHTIAGYTASPFVKKMGNNYIRPPVIRTNAILKNKNLNACLALWEFMDTYDKAGYTENRDAFQELPSNDYIRDLYMSVALQYVTFYESVVRDPGANKLLAQQQLQEILPDFSTQELPDRNSKFDLMESHYEKETPASRTMDQDQDLSKEELQIRDAIDIALKADIAMERKRLEEEAARKRAEEEARRKAEEEEARRRAEEEEARRKAEEEEARRLAEEEEARRKAEEEEARRKAEEEEARRKAQEEEARKKAQEEEAIRAAEEKKLVEEELEALRLAAEEEALIQAAQEKVRREQARKDAIRKAEEQKLAEQIAAAESLYYYPRSAYVSLPRKKKKRIQSDLKKLHEYEAALVRQSKTGKPEVLPAPPVNRSWDEIRRWERSVMPQKKT